MMRLHTNFRSTAAYRVRIALHWKGVDYEPCYEPLVRGESGPRFGDDLETINPQRMVPVLEDDGVVLTQSLAICEYLEERFPHPPLLPTDPTERARVRSLAYVIACDVHPLAPPRVLNYLGYELGANEAQVHAWINHWISLGMAAIEHRLAGDGVARRYCHGDAPTLADVCLVAQFVNAERFDIDMSPYARVVEVVARCRELEAFTVTAPARQPDATT